MGIFLSLSGVALRQACQAVGLDKAGDAVIDALTARFTDHSQRLPKALQSANERAWKAFEVALGGQSLWDKCKLALASAEDKALGEQIGVFLNASYLTKASAQTQHAETFRQALKELRAARSRGLLTGGPSAPDQLAREAGAFARFADPHALIDAEWEAVKRTAGELRECCPKLYTLVVARTTSGRTPSLLAVAVRYYFRREVESDQTLFQGLAVAKWEALQETQEKGFAALTDALSRQGHRLEGLLDSVLAVVKEIDVTTRDTNARVRGLEEQIQKLLERHQLQGRELRPGDSMSVRSEGDQQRVRQLVGEFRALPEDQRRQRPDLLNKMGVLRAAAGDLEEAQKDFEAAAHALTDPKARAEALHNAYRAALERQQWAEALAALRQAVALDPCGFTPFPFVKYEPQRILGAGGFGVVFLCMHTHVMKPVVVKALAASELDRAVSDVFAEAQALADLQHSAIIRLWDCDYADAARSRPYLVMDYFDGSSLDAHVEAQGLLSPEDMLAVAAPVAQALKAAHDRKILHRDVKPANLMVRRDGGGWQVKLIDFGLALRPTTLEGKPSTDSPRAQTTVGKSIAGTLHYAAPEQMGQGGEVGPHSDVYGFGKMCYFALLGTPEPDDMEKEDLPEPWRRFLSRCTGRKVANRLADFTAVLAELNALKTAMAAVKVQPVGVVGEPMPFEDHEDVPTDEAYWLDRYPAALECALWYREIIAKFCGDVPVKFGKGIITLYLGGTVRVAVVPRKGGRAVVSVEKLDEEDLAQAAAYLNGEGVAFTRKGALLLFRVNVQQLKEKQAAHEWIAQRLVPAAQAAGKAPGPQDEEHREEAAISRVADDEEAEARMIERLRMAPDRQWAESFFDLARDLIQVTGLDKDDPRLVMSLPQGGGIPVSVNSRYVLSALRVGAEQPGHAVLEMILPASMKDRISSLPGVVQHGPFAPNYAGETEAGAPLLVGFSTPSKFDFAPAVLDAWRHAVRAECAHGSVSRFRRFHEAVVFRAATDLEYRQRLLDRAFPRAVLDAESADETEQGEAPAAAKPRVE